MVGISRNNITLRCRRHVSSASPGADLIYAAYLDHKRSPLSTVLLTSRGKFAIKTTLMNLYSCDTGSNGITNARKCDV